MSGAARDALALLNVGDVTETFDAYAVTPAHRRLLASGTLAPGMSAVVTGSNLAAAGFDPIMVRAGGPMAVSENFTPSGGVGVVGMPGVPLAVPLGL
jgi:hypothetical protein